MVGRSKARHLQGRKRAFDRSTRGARSRLPPPRLGGHSPSVTGVGWPRGHGVEIRATTSATSAGVSPSMKILCHISKFTKGPKRFKMVHAGPMLSHEIFHVALLEDIAISGATATNEFIHDRCEGSSQPRSDRDGEPHLGALQYLTRKKIGGGAAEYVLSREPSEFHAPRQPRGEFQPEYGRETGHGSRLKRPCSFGPAS